MSALNDYRAACAAAINRSAAASTWEESGAALAEAAQAAYAVTREVRASGATGTDMLDLTPEWGHISDAQIARQHRFDREG